MRYVVDTQALVWRLTDDRRLGVEARRILDAEDSLIIVPAIVLAELKHIAGRRRVPLSFADVVSAILEDARCQIYPLDMFTIAHMPADLDIHDALIVATALLCRDITGEETAIITSDAKIRASRLLPVVW